MQCRMLRLVAACLILRHIFQDIVQQTINEYLPNELKRTRVNVFCFTEASLTSDSQGRRMLNSQQRTRSTGFLPGALKTRHRRKNSASSLTDSDSGKPGSALPPLSPYGGYASSEVGSDQGINDLRPRGAISTDRFTRGQSELRRTTQRSAVGQFHYFIACLFCSVVHFLCLLLRLSVTYSEGLCAQIQFTMPSVERFQLIIVNQLFHTE